MISERLAEAMRIRKMTVSELSRKSKTPHPRISNILSGKTLNPRIGTMARLAVALDVSVEWLAGGGEDILAHQPNEVKAKKEEFPVTYEELILKELMNKLQGLTSSQKKHAFGVMEEALDNFRKEHGKK